MCILGADCKDLRGFTRGVCVKIGDVILNLKAFFSGIPGEQAILRKSKTPRKSREKWSFLAIRLLQCTTSLHTVDSASLGNAASFAVWVLSEFILSHGLSSAPRVFGKTPMGVLQKGVFLQQFRALLFEVPSVVLHCVLFCYCKLLFKASVLRLRRGRQLLWRP